MQTIQISVIIPIFNADKYISYCIESILRQTFKAFQILLIDDGSTDHSLDICNNYANKDNRLKIFHKENEGVSVARQYGLDRVDTPYFIFCDSDDYVEPDYLEKLYNAITTNSADMAICKYKEEYNTHTACPELPETDINGLIHNFLNDKVWGITWNKLYRTDIIKQHKISFIPGLQMWEDLAFTIDYLLHIQKVVFVQKPLYHYVMYNTNSITRHENFKKKNDRIIAIRHIEQSMISANQEKVFHNSLIEDKYHIISVTYEGYGKERRKYFLNAFPEIFDDPYFKKHHFIIHILVKTHLIRLLYLKYIYGKSIKFLKNNIKKLIRK
ncbi:MAG: hypothetical protein BACD_03382 [Bacteroides rodentium]